METPRNPNRKPAGPRRGAARHWAKPGHTPGPGQPRAGGPRSFGPGKPSGGGGRPAGKPGGKRPFATGTPGAPRKPFTGPGRPKPSPANKSRSHGHVPPEFADAARGVRLQKVLAAAGIASKRAAEEMIAQGRVTVNGQPITALPAWVDPAHDRIEVDGLPVARPAAQGTPRQKIYVLLNKPRRVISTAHDPEGRRDVTGLVQLPPNLPTRVFPVGRLDADTTGLILLTNDGELTNRLTHPRYGITKEYSVSVRGRLTPEDVRSLQEGLYLSFVRPGRHGPEAGAKLASMAAVRLIGHGRDRNNNERTTLQVTLREGQNREVRRLLAQLGYKVRRLQRIAMGPLKLKGLEIGQWRFLEPGEIRALRQAAGL